MLAGRNRNIQTLGFALAAFVLNAVVMLRGYAATEPLDNIGEPFYSKRLVIEWNLRTNPLPQTIRLYEVKPPTFSPHAVSNLLAITGLSTNDLTRPASRPLAPLLFRKGDAYLTIDPENGHLEYYTIDRGTLWPTNVPNEKRSIALATNLLRCIGIPLAEFIAGTNGEPKPWFYPGGMGRLDQGTKEFVEVPYFHWRYCPALYGCNLPQAARL